MTDPTKPTLDEYHGCAGAFVIDADGRRVPDPTAVTTRVDAAADLPASEPAPVTAPAIEVIPADSMPPADSFDADAIADTNNNSPAMSAVKKK